MTWPLSVGSLAWWKSLCCTKEEGRPHLLGIWGQHYSWDHNALQMWGDQPGAEHFKKQKASACPSVKVSSRPEGQSTAFWPSRATSCAQMPLCSCSPLSDHPLPPKWSSFLLWPLEWVTEAAGAKGRTWGDYIGWSVPSPPGRTDSWLLLLLMP